MGVVMLLMVLLQALLLLEVVVVEVGVVSCCADGYRRDNRDCLHDDAGCG